MRVKRQTLLGGDSVVRQLTNAVILASGLIMASCSNDDDNWVTPSTDEVEAQLQKMTLREKVGQLFFVRPEVLDTTIHYGHTGGIDATTANFQISSCKL